MRSLKEMFKEIDEKDWSALHHAYGAASDVPGLLHGLVSEQEAIRYEAFYELCGTIWHQGTIYEATPHTIPYLLEMLRSPETPDKSPIALLVAEIADATSSLEHFAESTDEISRSFLELQEREGRNYHQELADERRYLAEARDAVGLGLGLLMEYLNHEEATIREGVARALGRYPQRKDELIPLLEATLTEESEDYVRESLEAAIYALESA